MTQLIGLCTKLLKMLVLVTDHFIWHGMGMQAQPYIVEGNQKVIEPRMTFTVESGLYSPGKVGLRIEDNVLVTPGGRERLTTLTEQFEWLVRIIENTCLCLR